MISIFDNKEYKDKFFQSINNLNFVEYNSYCATFIFKILKDVFNIEDYMVDKNINTKQIIKGSGSLLNKTLNILDNYKFYYFLIKYDNKLNFKFKTGDILLCKIKSINPNHLALYYKDGLIINSFPNKGIIVENINKSIILYIVRLYNRS